MNKQMLLRSFLFVPANNEKFVKKALCSDADAIILDMEDSVPSFLKQSGRELINRFCQEGKLKKKKIFIRVNELYTEEFVKDISQLLLADIDGIMPPKINSAEDIVYMDKLLEFFEIKNKISIGHFALAPLIETTQAVMNVANIARASKRLVALCLGGEDYLNDLGSVYTYQETALVLPRLMMVNAARSEGLLPIDTPYINFNDLDGFADNGLLAYKNGFAGCLLLNPKQIDIANKVFSPEESLIKVANDIEQALNETKDTNIIMVGGKMIGPPMIKRANNVKKQVAVIEEKMYET